MNLSALRAQRFPPQRVRYSAVEALRYALSVGAGTDPLDAAQLRLVYERQLLVLPTFATVQVLHGPCTPAKPWPSGSAAAARACGSRPA